MAGKTKSQSKSPNKHNDNINAVEVEIIVDDIKNSDKKLNKTINIKKSKKLKVPTVVKKEDGSLVKFDPLKRYIYEVGKIDLLTPEEEYSIAVEYKESANSDLAYKLITSNLRLVIKIAMEFTSHWTNLMDLIQEGNIGLMHAVRMFDPLKGVRLSTYARYWIRAYIFYFLMANYRLVKVGTTQAQRKMFFRLQKEKDRLLSMGIEPEAKLLADNLDVRENEVVEMTQRMDGKDLSIHEQVGGESGRTLEDFLSISNNELPEETLLKKQSKQLALDLAKEFEIELKDEREKIIWFKRVIAEDAITLREIGEKFSISRERARQLEKRLIDRYKKFVIEKNTFEIPD